MALDASPDDAIERHMKPHPLPPDVLYVVDQMMEDDLIDSGTYAALNMYVDRKELDDVLEGNAFQHRREPRAIVLEMLEDDRQPRPSLLSDEMRALGRYCIAKKRTTARAVIELADRTLLSLPEQIQGAIAYESLCWLRKSIKSLAVIEADWAYEDATVGGAMEAYRDVARLDGWGNAFKRDLRRLRSRAFIARYVKRCDSSETLTHIAKALLDRAERAPAKYLNDSLQDHAVILEQRRVAAREDALRKFFEAYQAETECFAKKPIVRERKRAIRARRQIIKRALKTASSIVGDRAVRAFVRGQWVRFGGCRFDLMVRCAFSVARLGCHGVDVRSVASDNPSEPAPHDLRVRIGDDGAQPLADLCVYIEDTPALDQLTGFALLMASGREDELIRTANIIKDYPLGESHPAFMDRAKQKRIADHTANADNWTVIAPYTPRNRRCGRHWYDRTKQREFNQAYVQETESIWIERLTLAVCGRRGKLLAAA